jgi:hypothetical protein
MSAPEKKEKTASEKNPYGYYGSGLVAPILTGFGDCAAAGATSRCVPRSFSGGDNPPQCSQYNNEDECPCQGSDPAFDKDSQLCSDSDKNSTARNPDYNPACYTDTDTGKDTTILTLGLAEYDPYYQEIDPCWLATDPSDAQCTCAILDMADGADGNSRNGICTGPNYADGTGGCYFNPNGQPAMNQDDCENGNLNPTKFNPNSDYYDANNNQLSRQNTCVWYPKEWYNVTSSDDDKTETKSVIPSAAALPNGHKCNSYVPSPTPTLSFRVLGVSQNNSCSNKEEDSCKTPNCAWRKKNDSEGVCVAVGDDALAQLCSNQSACLSNGHLPQTNGKCTSMVNGKPTSTTPCTVDAQCNANKGEFCKGTPTHVAGCTNNNDCENVGEWLYDAVPLVQIIDSTPAKKEYTCRSKKSFPWRGIVNGSKCVYLPESTGDKEDAFGAGAASVVKSGLKMIGAGFLGDLIDPQKKVKDRISAAKDRISQTTQQMPLSAQGAQVKIDADLIKYVDTNARLAKLTEQIAEDHLQFLVEKNTLLISILAIVLFISVIFELI